MHHSEDFLKKFWVSLALTMPLILWQAAPPYIALLIGSVIYFYCGLVFLKSALQELKKQLPGMMTLIALAVTTAYAWSVYSTLTGYGHPLWWELSTLILVMLLGHWLEMRAVRSAKSMLKELTKLLPNTADVIRGDEVVKIAPAELRPGDVVLVRPGGKVPADGRIAEGRSEINESIITGESRPVGKTVGQEVIAGSINGDGALRIEVTRVGKDTFLAGVARLVTEAEASKSRLQVLSDRAAYWLTMIAVGTGVVTLTAWLYIGAPVSVAVERMVAVLVIACPHALGLAVPLVASISTSMAARNGFLIRRRPALEKARKIDVVLFDKTGTLTGAEFKVTSASSDEALSLAAAVNLYSEHPIANAIVKEAKRRSLDILSAHDFVRVPGRGAEAAVGGKKVFVGTRGGEIVVEKEGTQIGTLTVVDTVRVESKEAVARLKSEGMRVAMITGDSQDAASRVAKELGIDEYFSRVMPGEKAGKVRNLQKRGLMVAMVGDGVNDAPALAQADLGIAIGAGTNVAIESADVILVRNDPRDISKIVSLSRLTYSKMVQNLAWATGYNVLALPVAAGALVPWGVSLAPSVAAVFMSLSTVIVSVNAMMLRRKSL